MIIKKWLFKASLLLIILSSCSAQKQSLDLSFGSADMDVTNQNIPLFSIEYLMGKYDPATHKDFVLIPKKYADRDDRFLRKDVLEAFKLMYEAASKDSVFLQIRSATRNFENQKMIWEKKWTGKTLLEDNINAATQIHTDVDRAKKILEYSSMPGSSRHHWGTDVDFNNFENEWFETGTGLKLYQWMVENANKFGFCQPYSAMGSDRNSGYFEERWHWTYVPVSGKLTELARTALTDDKIYGFLGSQTANEIGVVQNYVLGISPTCLVTQD